MQKLFSMFVVGSIVGAIAMPALACGGGGGGCGMGRMGGGRGYYGGARSVASTKVLAGGPRASTAASPTLAGVNRRPAVQPARPAHTVAAKSRAAAPPIYTCPMHPQVQWTKPTDCPVCGMKLRLKQTEADTARQAPTDVRAGTDDMSGMPGMDQGEMNDMMMCCPGCMMNMGGMSKSNGKQPPAARQKASRGSMSAMAGMGCGC